MSFFTKHLIALMVVLSLAKLTNQSGSMIDPPSRTNAWLYDKDFQTCCRYYEYNQMNCGGQNKLWATNEGKCGICGESWDEPKIFEKGGKKYLGKIVKTYAKDSVINVTIHITANHRGYFEFRLCNLDGWEGDATEMCLNKTLLKAENSNLTKFPIKSDLNDLIISYSLRLPSELTCNHCVLQWKWVKANQWGKTENRECLGCGIIQEHINGCSDISIRDPAKKETTVELLTTPKSITTSVTTSMKLQSIESKIVPGCQAKLEFGHSIPNVKSAVAIFCSDVCENKCLALISEYEIKLYTNSSSQPTSDLLTCLDTCPVLCTCHTARIP